MRSVPTALVLLILAAFPALADVVAVPEVVGEPMDEAIGRLDRAGFGVRLVRVAGPAVDVVARQSPPAGAEVEQGAVVTLRVGLRARIETVLPDVTGRLVEDALAILADAYDVEVEVVRDPEAKAGTVVASVPEPGAKLWYRSPLTLHVAEGALPSTEPRVEAPAIPAFLPRVAVPRVVGLAPDAARIAIEQAGFRLAVVPMRESDAEPRLGVAQDPEPGTSRTPGTVVVLYVPKEAPVPSVVGYTQMDAVRALAADDFATRFNPRGDGRLDARVIAQHPEPGEPAVCGSPVHLRFDDEKKAGSPAFEAPSYVAVPAVVGLMPKEARERIAAAGLECDLDGVEGPIEWQLLAAHARVAKGAVVRAGVGEPPPVDRPSPEVVEDARGVFRRAAGIRETPAEKRLRERRRR